MDCCLYEYSLYLKLKQLHEYKRPVSDWYLYMRTLTVMQHKIWRLVNMIFQVYYATFVATQGK